MKQLHAIVWKEDAWFVAKALEVEVASQGHSDKEALDNLQEALELYFEGQESPEFLSIEQPKIQGLSIQLHA